MTPPWTLARYRAFTGSRGGIIPKGSRPHPPRGVGDAAPYNDLRAFSPSFTPALFAAWHTPRQMFHVEHLPDFFVGKTPFLSLLFVL